MYKSIVFGFLGLFFLVACQPQTHLVKSDHQYLSVKDVDKEDASITALIQPYKEQVAEEMNTVIGETAKMLTKEQPESTLGNWATDLVHQQCEQYLKQKVDFAVLNYGGLRLPSLPKGKITKGKIFELMPFDNLLVVLEIKGSDLMDLFHHIAVNGGWPLSKQVKITTQKNKAIDVKINGQKIDKKRLYYVATNDYIANGGDKCSFLEDKKQLPTGKRFRDAILEFVEAETKAGRKLDAQLEQRIFVLK